MQGDETTGEDELSPVGATIAGLDGSGDLVAQDSTWSDPSALANAEALFEPIYFGFDQYAIGADERLNSKMSLLSWRAIQIPGSWSRVIVTGREPGLQ